MDSIGQSIRMPNLRDGYVALAKFIYDHGEKAAPRGQGTREIRNATLIVADARDTYPSGVGRQLNNGIAAVESAQLLAGESRPDLVMKIGPQFGKFVEPDGMFHGAYGVRTRGQFYQVIERLKDDPSSRQAVVTLWRPELDLLSNKKDYPCTVMYDFLIRDDKLTMEVVMRSNDLILGLAYDGFQHSRVQLALASVLGIPPGDYIHHVISLHLYERDFDKVEQLVGSQNKPTFFPALTGSTWDEVSLSARSCLDAAEGLPFLGAMNRDEKWYVDSMKKAVKRTEEKANV